MCVSACPYFLPVCLNPCFTQGQGMGPADDKTQNWQRPADDLETVFPSQVSVEKLFRQVSRGPFPSCKRLSATGHHLRALPAAGFVCCGNGLWRLQPSAFRCDRSQRTTTLPTRCIDGGTTRGRTGRTRRTLRPQGVHNPKDGQDAAGRAVED